MKKFFVYLSLLFLINVPFFSAERKSYYTPDEVYVDPEFEREAEMAAAATGNASRENAVMSSRSVIDWTKNEFTSAVTLDVTKAGIPMPSGKASSLNRIQMELPVLVKDPLLSIYVDDSRMLSDLVLEGTLTLEELTRIMDSSRQTPAVFDSGTSNLLTQHTVTLQNIGALLVRHHTPYTLQQPIETISTRKYSGIIIDARGSLPVQGEFISSEVQPCLFPKIWNEKMDLLYERNMVNAAFAKEKGIVSYSSSIDTKDYADRVGNDPLWITAKKVFGINRCDPVISYDDFLRITSIKSNLELLKEGKVVILLDKHNLVHGVSAPERNKKYYLNYHNMRRYVLENPIPDTELDENQTGVHLKIHNLQFIADSAELLPGEKPRISQIAEDLKKFLLDGSYNIIVEGHTADVKTPEGQLQLSIERAQAIIEALVDAGLDRDMFSYKGYGGTKPLDTNSTPEGRARNRRVEITAIPKASYIQYK